MTTAKRSKRERRAHRKGQGPPSQRCAGCSVAAEADELLRMVISEEYGVLVDPRQRIPGTAVYLHPAVDCVHKLADAGLVHESNPRREVSEAELQSAMERFLDAAILAELSRVAAAGQAIGGHDKLAAALREGQISCVLVAVDAATGTVESLRRAAGASLPFHRLNLDKDALGERIGQKPRAAVGFPSSRASAVLEKWLAQRWQLGESSASSA